MEKSLLSAGTTWPGVYLVEDQRALDVLSGRPEVDATQIGCAGLSGGGMRTMFLGGMDIGSRLRWPWASRRRGETFSSTNRSRIPG